MVPGNSINYHLSTKYVGGTDSLKEKVENHHHDNFCLKYPIMSTYSGLIEYTSQKVSTHPFASITDDPKTGQFKCKIIFANNFNYCHAENGHNKPSR